MNGGDLRFPSGGLQTDPLNVSYFIDTAAFDCEALLLAGNNAAGEYSVKH